MNAHLVGSASFETAFDQRGPVKRHQRAVMRHRVLAPPFLDQRHLLAIMARPADGTPDRARRWQRPAGGDAAIGALDGMVGELPRQPFVRHVRLGHDQQARGILVDTMDDPGPRHAADAGKLPLAMVQQRVNQRAVQIACGRVDNQPRRLVDHDQVGVFVDHHQGNVLRHRLGRHDLGHPDGKGPARARLGRSLRRDAAAHFDPALLDQGLYALAREAGDVRQRPVKPQPASFEHAGNDIFASPHGPHYVGGWPARCKKGRSNWDTLPDPALLQCGKKFCKGGGEPALQPAGSARSGPVKGAELLFLKDGRLSRLFMIVAAFATAASAGCLAGAAGAEPPAVAGTPVVTGAPTVTSTPAVTGTPAGPAPAVAPQPGAQPEAAAPASGPIGYFTAGKLADRCQEDSAYSMSYCFAYLAAVHDTARAYEVWLSEKEFCIPPAISQDDLRKTYLAHLAANPGHRLGQAGSVIIVALKEAYPCPPATP